MDIDLVYLSLGSNLGDKEGNLRAGIKYLKEIPELRVVKKSSLYQTDPVGYAEQDVYLNAVISVETAMHPLLLLKHILEVEHSLGRVRTIRWGPRTLDIDILLFNKEIINHPMLVIPHPEMHRRRFVLVPLLEINPIIVIPGLGTGEELLKECQDLNRVYLVKNNIQW